MRQNDLTRQLLIWFASRWMRHASGQPLDDRSCVACGSTSLLVEAPGVYTCSSCGYEGGSQRAAWLREKHRREAEQLPLDQRAARATALLREAHRQLLEADELYAQLDGRTIYEDSGEGTVDGNQAASAFASLATARHLLERAVDFDPSLRPPEVGEVRLGTQDLMRDQAREQLARLLGWFAREPRAALDASR